MEDLSPKFYTKDFNALGTLAIFFFFLPSLPQGFSWVVVLPDAPPAAADRAPAALVGMPGDGYVPGASNLAETYLGQAGISLLVADTIYREQTETVCEGETIEVFGETIGQDTTICRSFSSSTGADSLHCVTVDVLPVPLTEQVIHICEGETVRVGEEVYFESGRYETRLTAASGCDSLVVTELTVFPAPRLALEGELEFCAGDSTTLTISGDYAALQWLPSGVADTTRTIAEAGRYQVVGASDEGCRDSLQFEVRSLSLSTRTEVTSHYGGFDVSCPDAADGAVRVEITGGIGPYFASWSNGINGLSASGFAAGSHAVQVIDKTGCRAEDSITLFGRPPLVADTRITDPRCAGLADGQVQVDLLGDSGPFLYSLNGSAFQANNLFSALPAGSYTVIGQDSYGCEWSDTINLEDPPPFTIAFSEGQPELLLGDSLLLTATPSTNEVDRIWWSPADDVSCDNCLATVVRPFESTTYTVFARSNKGCAAEASVRVRVNTQTRIFTPNAFSPNGDGYNDTFLVYPGPGVRAVISLLIFNRWGEKVFERHNLPTEMSDADGWNGLFNGQLLAAGVYVFVLEVELVDGRQEIIKGDIALMR